MKYDCRIRNLHLSQGKKHIIQLIIQFFEFQKEAASTGNDLENENDNGFCYLVCFDLNKLHKYRDNMVWIQIN